MILRIISADERLNQAGAPKILLAGPPGVGKTSQLRTLPPETTLFFDMEAGDLSVRDVPVDQVRARTWKECRDLAAFLGGVNPNVSEDNVYGLNHYNAGVEQFGDVDMLAKYRTYFIDSITVAARLCLAWAGHQPEAFNQAVADYRGWLAERYAPELSKAGWEFRFNTFQPFYRATFSVAQPGSLSQVATPFVRSPYCRV